MEEKSVQEAADFLGVRPGYVRLLIHKEKLKKGRILGKLYLIDNESLRQYAETNRGPKGRPRSGEHHPLTPAKQEAK